ncbi:MAG: hypothetical protein EA425_03275 [Puniceicoccaceae bacterium]|nr:MAG: hypothetical protein EA425_03275 [Puniceicoccaceae bacterium]
MNTSFLPLVRLLSLGACGLSALSLSAGTILSYDLSAQPSQETSVAASTVAEGLSATDLVRGPGPNPAGLVRGFSANQWTNNEDHDPLLESTRENAILQGDYFEFGFSVLEGFSASLDTLDVSLRRSGLGAPEQYEWQFSFDSFATPGTTLTQFTYFGRASAVGETGATTEAVDFNYMIEDVANQGEGNPMPTVLLSGIEELQSIDGGTTVTFRLYAWGADRNSRTVAIGRNDGPALGGTIIPEPRTYALILGALIFMGVLLRSRLRN